MALNTDNDQAVEFGAHTVRCRRIGDDRIFFADDAFMMLFGISDIGHGAWPPCVADGPAWRYMDTEARRMPPMAIWVDGQRTVVLHADAFLSLCWATFDAFFYDRSDENAGPGHMAYTVIKKTIQVARLALSEPRGGMN